MQWVGLVEDKAFKRMSKMGAVARISRAMKILFSREDLPEDLPHISRRSPGGEGFLVWLFKPDPLEEDPCVLSQGKRSFFSWLFSREGLPLDPVEERGEGGFLGVLFRSESLSSEEKDAMRD